MGISSKINDIGIYFYRSHKSAPGNLYDGEYMRTFRNVGLMAGCFATFAALLIATQTVSKSPGKFVEEFGEKIGEPIDKGFVFFDGKYVESPYTVSRKGIEVFINDCKLHCPVTWPPPKEEDDKIPPLPSKLTVDSTLDDLKSGPNTMDRHDRKAIYYYLKHYEIDEAYDRIVAYYKSLPFVKDARRDRHSLVIIECKNGTVVTMFVGCSRPQDITKESVLKNLEGARERLEKRLKEGDCYYLFTTGDCEISFGRATAKRDLPKIVKILQSGETAETKKKQLEARVLLPSVGKQSDLIIENFAMSDQLEKRLKALETESEPKDDGHPLPSSGPSEHERWLDTIKQIKERLKSK